ncbi:MAG: phosphatidylserine/phosphatidylglycerophosphate/cardiolipin synthase family protein [Myxococcales bacterium]
MFRRIFVIDHEVLPSVASVQAFAPGAPLALVGEETALAQVGRPEVHDRGSPAGRAPLDAGALVAALGLEREDLVVLGPMRQRSARARADLAVRLAIQHGLFVLSVGSRCPQPSGPARHVAFLSAADASELEALSALVPRFSHVARLSGFLWLEGHGRRAALEATLRTAGRDRLVSVMGFSGFPTQLAHAIDRAAVAAGVDLVVVPSDAVPDAAVLAGGFLAADALQSAERPTLILPRTTRAPALLADRLAASDTLDLPGQPRALAVERNGPLGRVQLAEAERLLCGGRTLDHELGVVALPASEPGEEEWLAPEADPPNRCRLRSLAPTMPLLLVDARSPVEVLAPLEPFAADSHVVFVRLRWDDPIDRLRHKLTERAPWAGVPLLIDASAWLGDGGASDLPEAVDPIRLRRLATRLAALGARIRSVVGGAVERPWPVVESGDEDQSAQVVAPTRVEGNEVRFELDNARAREALLEAISSARRSVHWQCYIVEEGPVAERFATALAEAAGRGVQVRLLIDALYSRHDVFRARNPVLQRLDAVPGVDVCAYRPVAGVPDLVALKQRNHRKLVIVDDELAVVTGRNLGAPYYTGFAEVALKRQSSYRHVPWLDCGATVRGPVVAQVQRAFLASWRASGGTPFEPGPVPAPAGPSACTLVLHDGLRDTNTFDAQLDLVRRARERLVVVNAFPLAVEMQRALVDAARRGVRVQVLFGCARPRHGEDRPFGGGVLRDLADRLIRARLDPVLRAGGELCELLIEPPLPGWEPELARVFPYVHAKVLVRDGEEAAVGSANLDVTSAYWESEALLLVEDRAAAGTLLAGLEPLLASARRPDVSDERWQQEASLRARLDRVWPTLVG